MKRVKLIVEGKGELSAAISLVSKCAAHFNVNIVVAPPPIRAGEARKLRRAGELERHIELAASHDVEEILILLDLDDDCAVEFSKEFLDRGKPIADARGKKLKLCFCVREFETWFLDSIDDLRSKLPEYNIDQFVSSQKVCDIRGAKEALHKLCRTKGYKPMRDQNIFVKKLNIRNLLRRNRSFRKFVKEITDLDYCDLNT